MSRRIFMTSLGNSDYKVARYRGLYEGEEIKEGRFFPELRLRQLIQDRHLAFDQVFLLLTREASEAHWSEGGELQHALKALGVSPRVVPITIPQSEQELYELVEQCSQLFEEGDELYLEHRRSGASGRYDCFSYVLATCREAESSRAGWTHCAHRASHGFDRVGNRLVRS